MPQSPNNSLGSLSIVDGSVPPDFLLKLNDRLRRIEQALGLVSGSGTPDSVSHALTAGQAVTIVDQGALATLNAVDLGTDQVVNKLIDYLSDTANYAKVSANALAGNLIDLSKAGVIGKILDNIADTANYAKVSATALTGSAVDLAKPGVIGKTMDNIAATATWGKVLAAALTTEGEIDLAAAQVINKNLDNIAGTATWGKVLASSLAANGAIDLSVAGILNKTLEWIGDTATWRKVAKVNTGNQTTTGSYYAGSITAGYSTDNLPEAVISAGATGNAFPNDLVIPASDDTSIWYNYEISFSGAFEVATQNLYVTIKFTVDGLVFAQYVYPGAGGANYAVITPVTTLWSHPSDQHSFNVQIQSGNTEQMTVVAYMSIKVSKA